MKKEHSKKRVNLKKKIAQKNIVVKLTGDNILKKAWLEGLNQGVFQAEELHFNNQGIATRPISVNVEYTLTWEIIGTPGNGWEFEVTEPPCYQWRYYASAVWHSEKISIKGNLSETAYYDMRIIAIK